MIGDVLRILRFINGDLTLETVSKGSKVTMTNISAYETNKKKPTEEMLFRLAEFYHIPSEKIIELSTFQNVYSLDTLELTYLIAEKYNARSRILTKRNI